MPAEAESQLRFGEDPVGQVSQQGTTPELHDQAEFMSLITAWSTLTAATSARDTAVPVGTGALREPSTTPDTTGSATNFLRLSHRS